MTGLVWVDMKPFDSARTALIVIDVQRGFDLWEAAGGTRRNNPDAVARIADLLDAFRAAGAPVFHVRHSGTRPDSLFLPDGPGFEVMDAAREHPGEAVVVKQVNSAFIGTDLEAQFRAASVTSVVICGATTNYCVETSTRMAGNLGFDTWLVRDATWTYDHTGPDGDEHPAAAVHAMTLANLNGEFAQIATSAAIVAALAKP